MTRVMLDSGVRKADTGAMTDTSPPTPATPTLGAPREGYWTNARLNAALDALEEARIVEQWGKAIGVAEAAIIARDGCRRLAE
jgi:hypothetical protein